MQIHWGIIAMAITINLLSALQQHFFGVLGIAEYWPLNCNHRCHVHGQRSHAQSFLTRGLLYDSTFMCRDAAGSPLPSETLEACKASDAVLLAAIGG